MLEEEYITNLGYLLNNIFIFGLVCFHVSSLFSPINIPYMVT